MSRLLVACAGRPARVALLAAAAGCQALTVPECASPHPAGPPEAAVFLPEFVGTWRAEDPETEEDGLSALEVLRFDERQYLLTLHDAHDGTATRFRAYLTEIEGVPLLSATPLESDVETVDADGEPGWFLARLDFDGADRLDIRLVAIERIPSGETSTPERLHSYLRLHLDEEALYDGGTSSALIRTREPG